MKRIIIILIFSLFLPGCAGLLHTPIIKQEIIPEQRGNDAIIIVGEEIGEGNIIAMKAVLYKDGSIYPSVKGVVIAGQDKLPALVGEFGFDVDYAVAGKGRHVYRVFVIPEKIYKTGKNSILYVSSLRSKEFGFGHIITRRTISYLPPIGCSNLIKTCMGEWEFKGASFKLDKPGIYYLGEIKVDGNISKGKDKDWQELHAEHTLTFSKDIIRFRDYLSKNNLKDVSYVDLSDSWKIIDGKYFYDYIDGKM